MYFHITKLFVLLIFLVPLISAQYEDDGYYPTTKWYMRAPKSISGLFRRLLGRRKNIRTGFQGTAIANGPYSSQPSSYYSSFFSNPFSSGSPNSGPSNYPGSQSQGSSGLSGFSSNLWSPSLSSYTNVVGGMGSSPAAGTNYPTYSPPASGPGSGNPANLDFHAVLDQFVRSAGLSPTGDQDTSASTIQSKGDSPVFSFKKLYSFPFYLSTDQQQPSDQGFNLQIPYMRKHIRRALHESPFKNPKFFVDKQSIQNWLLPKNWYHGQQALQQSASSIIPTTTNIQWPNGQESPILGGGHQRLYRGKPIEHNPRLIHQQGIPMQASSAPSTIRSPVVPNSGVAPSLVTSGPLKPGHLHQAQQSQPKAQIHPQSPISQSTSTSSSSSSSSSSTIVSAPSVSSSSVAPTNDQTQSQQQQGSASSGQLTDSNILSSQAFITQYLQEHFAAANQKQLNGLNIKDDQEANESQYAPAYYYGSVANKGQQQPSQQGKQQVSGQEKGQPASGLPSSSSSSSSSTSLVSGDQSSPISSYQVSYSSGGYGASS